MQRLSCLAMVVGSSVVLNTSLVEEGDRFFSLSSEWLRDREFQFSCCVGPAVSSFREIIEGVDGLMNAARRYDGEPQKKGGLIGILSGTILVSFGVHTVSPPLCRCMR